MDASSVLNPWSQQAVCNLTRMARSSGRNHRVRISAPSGGGTTSASSSPTDGEAVLKAIGGGASPHHDDSGDMSEPEVTSPPRRRTRDQAFDTASESSEPSMSPREPPSSPSRTSSSSILFLGPPSSAVPQTPNVMIPPATECPYAPRKMRKLGGGRTALMMRSEGIRRLMRAITFDE
ncbi:unnamed protein product [Closterium sp. Naga37s-1]|nr:unnamed protein product [Closterium sp. Naga37s-1]